MTACVFLGPTLSRHEASGLIDAEFLPPVAQGDVIRAVARRPTAIGIVDGFFEAVPSVWHKEILFALASGIPVFGAASMGALRAAEQHPFGMIGVGAVFEAYHDGRLEDDDEVAVTHGPAELGYPILSEAMVNIRRTLSDAAAAEVIDAGMRRLLEGIAKELPYRERSYGRVLRVAADLGAPAVALERFRLWLPEGRADQKADDARAMLKAMATAATRRGDQPPAHFHFEHTLHWDRAAREAARFAA